MFHHILFPVDFSERCKQAVPFVKAFAQRHGAAITLMHVIHIPAGCYGGIETAFSGLFDVAEMETDAQKQLTAFYSEGAGAAPPVDGFVTYGDPGNEVVAYAKESEIDLIMMPTSGHGRFRRWLLGSITAQVLHDAQCPVWTATHTEEAELGRHVECKRIVCAVGRSETSLPVIRHAKDLAAESGAIVSLVHAVPFAATPDTFHAESQRLFSDSMANARQQIEDLQKAAGTEWSVCVKGGEVAEVVREAALQHQADLVVAGRGRLPEWFGGLRTHAYAVIRDSPCPVLSI